MLSDGVLTVSGNMTTAQLTLTSRATGRHRALGQARIAGWVDNSTVHSAGDIGSFTAGGLRDSAFDVLATIATVRITGAALLPPPAARDGMTILGLTSGRGR